MVFGNMGDDSGTGVAFTRDPNTGEKALYGEYLTNAQGEDVVAGIRTAPKIAQMQTDMPEVYGEFLRIGEQLEQHYRDVQDLEFTIERGKLYMLQTRSRQADRRGGRQDRHRPRRRGRHLEGGGARPDRAGPRRPAPARPVRPRRAAQPATRIAKGLNASPGAAVGRAVFDADTAVEWVGHGERVVLVRIETSPDDFHGMAVAPGHPDRPRRRHLPRRGRRPPDRQAVRGRLPRAAHRLRHQVGRTATGTASTSRRATGSASTARPARSSSARCRPCRARFEDQPELQTILGWADEVRRMQVWTNADKPEEAALARTLRRAGHRPVPDRAHVPRRRAARDRARRDPRRQRRDPGQGQGGGRRHARRDDEAETVATFDAAMAKLEVLQQGDFEGIFRAMDGLPVVIRLIDPPLHEFLPNLEDQLVKVTRAEDAGGDSEEDKRAPRDDQEHARAEPDARPARLPARPDDPGLREGPDPGDPQRAHRGRSRPAGIRRPRS